MAKPNTRRLDREIELTSRKLKAVRKGEIWPLTGQERRAVLRALAGGSYKVVRGKSPARAEQRLEAMWNAVQLRLAMELTGLQAERQRIVNDATAAKAAKKSSSWW
ncbi:hypothetical protein [Streptomyces sp. NPDC126514]|uniref:hypothetical protein n=1 Tax=Streptomyces sp. NPDC126514 TaxID=3155210 RepID=UPI00332ECFD5